MSIETLQFKKMGCCGNHHADVHTDFGYLRITPQSTGTYVIAAFNTDGGGIQTDALGGDHALTGLTNDQLNEIISVYDLV